MESAAKGPSLTEGQQRLVGHAREVAEAALNRLRALLLARTGLISSTLKADGTPITTSDVEAHEHLVAAIEAAFPDHNVISEEGATVSSGGWEWVLDPIDGTSNFAAGLPYWSVSVALVLDGWPVLGIVDAPALDVRYVAERDRGSERDGVALAVRPPADWRRQESRYVPVMLTPGLVRRADRAVRLNPRIMGSIALDLCTTAAGAAVATFHPSPHVWDVAAAWVMIEEAGGVVVTLDGDPLLPLRTGTDYAHRIALTAAGPSERYLRDLAAALWGTQRGPATRRAP